jgi:hypothetical protein
MEVFNKLLETIEKSSINNKATIENVELFVKAWKKEAESLQLRKADVSGSVFSEIYSDLTTISASLLTKKLSEFEEDWNFCKTTPKKDIYKVLNNVEFQNSIQRSLANKLSAVKDKFFKHYR